MYCKTFYNTYGVSLEIARLLPTEQVDKSSIYIGHCMEHTLACGSILLECEHLKSQKKTFNDNKPSLNPSYHPRIDRPRTPASMVPRQYLTPGFRVYRQSSKAFGWHFSLDAVRPYLIFLFLFSSSSLCS